MTRCVDCLEVVHFEEYHERCVATWVCYYRNASGSAWDLEPTRHYAGMYTAVQCSLQGMYPHLPECSGYTFRSTT
jgi:hypothetical protein